MTNPVIDCLLGHRSIRRYKAQPLEPEKLQLILRAGIRAASAGNLQAYSLIVVDDPEKKRALCDSPLVDASTIIVSVVDQYRLKRWLELNDAPFYFNQAPNLFIGYWDAIIALHNVQIAAESLGLGGVYVGTVLSVDIAQVLGVPEYVFPAGMICIGYPDETPELRPRLPLEAVVHRNGYQVPTDDEIRGFYRQKDRQWDELPAETRQRLQERGIHNIAQRRTVGHYTEAFITREHTAILANLSRSRFNLSPEAPAPPAEPRAGTA